MVTGMTCAACQAHVEKAVSKVPGVDKVTVSLLMNSMSVEGSASADSVVAAVEAAGYGAKPMDSEVKSGSTSGSLAAEEEALKDRETPKLKKRLILSLVFLAVLMYLSMGHNMLGFPVPSFLDGNYIGLGITQMILALIVMFVNRAFFTSGFRSLFQGAPNMDALVALGSGVSFLWSLSVLYKMTYFAMQGESIDMLYRGQLYFESAAMIPALITVGKLLESLSKGRTTDALKGLMKLAPETANIERDGMVVTVGISEVKPGDIFVVKPGESIPVDKGAGDTVSTATINTTGFIRVKATRVGEDTTFSQIVHMVSDAAATKAPIARIADKVSAVFVPAVIGVAIVVFIIWKFLGADTATALEYAICVLVISCPCALGLATPVAIMVGNGMGAKNGILFKTSEDLENAGKVKIVALDKTGTITTGRPEVTDIVPAEGVSEEELLTTAYSLEGKSEHPLARAIVEEGEKRNLKAHAMDNFRIVSGSGLLASDEGISVHGGSLDYISTYVSLGSLKEKAEALADEGKTPLFFEKGKKLLGMIAVADAIKEDSARAIRMLHDMGIETVMVTGDNEKTAKTIAKKAGVDRVIAGVLPSGKEEVIRELQKRGRVAMVGDGINDAPALTRADTGIAIGAGTDVAIDSAGIVLINSRLTDVAAAIRLSRKTLKNIYENLFWAFAYNVILIPVAAGLYPGIHMSPMWGAAAMSLSSFTVCMNALRLNFFKMKDGEESGEATKGNTPVKEAPVPKKEAPKTASAPSKDNLKKEVLHVEGMMCENCERHVKEALEALPFIESAKADHVKGTVDITSDGEPDRKAMEDAISKAGYTLKDEPSTEGKATVLVGGMMCENCEKHVKKALESLPFIESASADYTTGRVAITYSSQPVEEEMKDVISKADYEYQGIEFPKEENKMKETVKIEGMMCNHCEATVKKALEALDGVDSAEVSHEKGTAVLSVSKAVADADIQKAVEDKDYKFVGIEK